MAADIRGLLGLGWAYFMYGSITVVVTLRGSIFLGVRHNDTFEGTRHA